MVTFANGAGGRTPPTRTPKPYFVQFGEPLSYVNPQNLLRAFRGTPPLRYRDYVCEIFCTKNPSHRIRGALPQGEPNFASPCGRGGNEVDGEGRRGRRALPSIILSVKQYQFVPRGILGGAERPPMSF